MIPDSVLGSARDAYDGHLDATYACEPEALRAALEAVTAPRMVESLNDLRAAVAGVTPGRPLVLVDRQGWPWTVQVDDGTWLVRVPERFAAPRFACELAGEWAGAGAAVREYGPLRVLDGPEAPRG